jgi:hypothetical protein
MTWVAVAVGVGTTAAGVYAANQQGKTAEKASQAQIESGQAAIEEDKRQFDFIQKLLSPYVQAGETALTQQQALAGLGGAETQQAAIEMIEQSPQFQALTKAGEEAILQSASATGGLRGGNTQTALAQYRPQVLGNLIDTQYNRLAGISNLGQVSAAGVGSAAQASSANVGNILQQIGAARAGNYLTQGQASANVAGSIQQGLLTGLLAGGKF